MKLRNKKTGEITEARKLGFERYTFNEESYDSLAEFNEYWEDYNSVEPLIEDEKIRKAVRAWAEANNIYRVAYHKCSHYWYLRSFNDNKQAIDFWLSYNAVLEMNEDEFYTIAELCGEEE